MAGPTTTTREIDDLDRAAVPVAEGHLPRLLNPEDTSTWTQSGQPGLRSVGAEVDLPLSGSRSGGTDDLERAPTIGNGAGVQRATTYAYDFTQPPSNSSLPGYLANLGLRSATCDPLSVCAGVAKTVGNAYDSTPKLFTLARTTDPGPAPPSRSPDDILHRTYAGNNPVNATDPSGMRQICWQALEFGLTAASRHCWASGYARAWNDIASQASNISAVAGIAAIFTPPPLDAALGAVAVVASGIATINDVKNGQYLKAGLDALATFTGGAGLGAGLLASETDKAATAAWDAGNAVVDLAKSAESAHSISRDLNIASAALSVITRVMPDQSPSSQAICS